MLTVCAANQRAGHTAAAFCTASLVNAALTLSGVPSQCLSSSLLTARKSSRRAEQSWDGSHVDSGGGERKVGMAREKACCWAGVSIGEDGMPGCLPSSRAPWCTEPTRFSCGGRGRRRQSSLQAEHRVVAISAPMNFLLLWGQNDALSARGKAPAQLQHRGHPQTGPRANAQEKKVQRQKEEARALQPCGAGSGAEARQESHTLSLIG